jgi:serine/threonine-protein kinase
VGIAPREIVHSHIPADCRAIPVPGEFDMSATTSSIVDVPAAPPQSIFEYEVIDLVGEGAGSLIYAVSDPQTRQIYALKHVVRKTEKHARFIEQLQNEYAVGTEVNHPNLRRIIAMRENRTLLRKVTSAALVMEHFDGMPLEMHLPPSIASIVQCFIETAHALEALHRAGFVHCDLKPNNILMNASGQVKVIDLGQACAIGTAKKRIQGTPDYIAPEQVKCAPVTVRTDVFNFGATLYWSLTGRKLPTLFTLKKGDNSLLSDELMAAPSTINSRIPESLSNFVMECVRTSPSKRPEDMGEVIRRLEIIRYALLRNANVA